MEPSELPVLYCPFSATLTLPFYAFEGVNNYALITNMAYPILVNFAFPPHRIPLSVNRIHILD